MIVASRYTTWELAQTNVEPFTPRKDTANKRPPLGERVFARPRFWNLKATNDLRFPALTPFLPLRPWLFFQITAAIKWRHCKPMTMRPI